MHEFLQLACSCGMFLLGCATIRGALDNKSIGLGLVGVGVTLISILALIL